MLEENDGRDISNSPFPDIFTLFLLTFQGLPEVKSRFAGKLAAEFLSVVEGESCTVRAATRSSLVCSEMPERLSSLVVFEQFTGSIQDKDGLLPVCSRCILKTL
jgi:hypothetical protein